MIRGLIFDLDGVITETASLHFNAWKEILAEHGINLTKEVNSKIKGLPRVETLVAILKHYNKSDLFSQEQLIEVSTIKNNLYKKMLETDLSEKDILPGVVQLLEDAKSKNLKLAVASSSYNAPMILEKINLIKYFEYIVNPGSVKNGKPAPDLFLKACEGIGIKPAEAIGFEDAIAGIEGLHLAKIKSVAITHGEANDWSLADYVVQSTSELDLEKILTLLS